MTPAMDLQDNRRMDWFFQQYVYGTGIPKYVFRYQVAGTADGKWKITGSLKRSGVPENWIDMIPFYLHRPTGPARIGWINAKQPETRFDLILPMKPEKISINDSEDILAEINQ